MFGHYQPPVEHPDPIWQLLDLDKPAGAIGHAVIVAADGNEPIVADASLKLEDGIKAMFGQGLQLGNRGLEAALRDWSIAR